MFQAVVPEVIDVDQESDIEVVQTPGVRRAQLERVANLLAYFYPPTHVKGEVSDPFFFWFFISFSFSNSDIFSMSEVRGRPPNLQVPLVYGSLHSRVS